LVEAFRTDDHRAALAVRDVDDFDILKMLRTSQLGTDIAFLSTIVADQIHRSLRVDKESVADMTSVSHTEHASRLLAFATTFVRSVTGSTEWLAVARALLTELLRAIMAIHIVAIMTSNQVIFIKFSATLLAV
jgi:hypothetical protein